MRGNRDEKSRTTTIFLLCAAYLIFSVSFLIGTVFAVKQTNISSFNMSEEIIILNASESILIDGKNYVTFDMPKNVADLVKKNPDIEYASYHDVFLDETIGYVNVFGGLGKNFVLNPGKIYEIHVKKDTK